MTMRNALLLPSCLIALLAVTGTAAAQSITSAAPIISSPISGVVFHDAPKILPVDSRFSQAVQTIGFDIGLTCGQVESYGWNVAIGDQDRVNAIFTDTARELARLGYMVTPQSPGSAAADITVYTASRSDKNVLFTWSAGNAGLLLLMCDGQQNGQGSDTGLTPGFGPAKKPADAAEGIHNFGLKPAIAQPLMRPQNMVGEWIGTYSCVDQGASGGTLSISRVRKERNGYTLNGVFSFYPLAGKNPDLPRGSYRVTGRFDEETQRAILEPGAWLQRPKDFYNAVMITQFNLEQGRSSSIFQGTTGCTSFEAAYKTGSADRAAKKAWDETPKKKKKPVVKKKPAPQPTEQPAELKPAEPIAAPAETTPVETTPTAVTAPVEPTTEAAPVATPAPVEATPAAPAPVATPAVTETTPAQAVAKETAAAATAADLAAQQAAEAAAKAAAAADALQAAAAEAAKKTAAPVVPAPVPAAPAETITVPATPPAQ